MNANNDYLLSWAEFHRDTLTLATRLLEQHPETLPWRGIIGIARGGLVPATILAREFDIRFVDSLCISSYSHDQQGEIEIIKPIEGNGAGFLLVDDMVDTGATARVIRDLLPQAHFVTVYAKPAGRDFTECFIREFPQDTWVHFPWDTDQRFVEPQIHRRPK